ncbi:hypothetical protein RIVM261_047260 [Rivularia sp. IAM M-261]|nr:hypothetical protein CAL7716_088400 [Calothrix sp. PCC 7716]GJD19770.1 hypothetical protein RIVM261_047260 [Rivularia sp. IAM M-261]
MNAIEGVYIIGGLLGPLLFSFMIQWYYWQNAYLIIAVMTGIAGLFLLKTNINESEVVNQESTQPKLSQTFTLLYYPLVWVFLICNVLCGMLELGYKTWLPTFNTQVFQLSEAQSVLFLSIFSGGMALSRFSVGYLQKNLSWLSIQIINLASGFVLTLIVLMAASQKQYALLLAFMLASVGLFFGSIYPTICSSMLSLLPKYCHGAMTGLIVIFGQIGMTLGVSIIGFLSKKFSIHNAFYITLVPMLILPVLLFVYNKLSYNFNLAKS